MINSRNYQISDIAYELAFSNKKPYSLDTEQEEKILIYCKIKS